MRTFRTLSALAGLVLAVAARPQWPCDSLLHASFTASPDPVHARLVHFDNTSWSSSGSNTTYTWSFGNGAQAPGADLVYEYPANGVYTVCLWAVSGNCFDSACTTITVGAPPDPCSELNAGFSANVTGQMAHFQNASQSNNVAYQWLFGDGTSSSGLNPVHTYQHPGQYHVCLKAWTWDPQTQDTCFVDNCEWISVGDSVPDPCDQLNAGYQVTTNGNVAHFHNASNDNNTMFYWSFGDGTSGFGADPVHTYPHAGQYQSCLTAWIWDPMTQDSCMATHCEAVIIGGGGSPCDSLFQVAYSFTQDHGTVTFNASSSLPNTSFYWDLGNGNTATGPLVQHQYAPGQEYLVCLYGWTSALNNGSVGDSCTAHVCNWITVIGDSLSPCDNLSADFLTITQGHTASFSAVDAGNMAYQWHFGDGTTGFGADATHTYAQPGQYHACLITYAWDPMTQDSCAADHCEWVTIIGDSLSPCDQLNAGFQVTTSGNAATFHSSNVSGATYIWHFGDGSQGFGPNPMHTYAQPGQYHACLITYAWDAMTQDSCMADHCEWVTISGGGSPCDSLFQASFSFTQQNGHVMLTGTSTLPAFYNWDLGDGSSANGPVVQHTYPHPGQYTVCLYAYGDIFDGAQIDSCFAQYCHVIIVHGDSLSPCDQLNAGFQVTTNGNAATFHSSNVPGAVYSWNFGDGTHGNGPNPSHTYAQPGQYHACLVTYAWDAVTQDTCMADHCEWVTISGGGSPCDSLFQTSFSFTQQNGHVVLTGTSSLPAFYTWDLGDGSSANGAVVQHTYPHPGQYTVCLYAYGDIFDGAQIDSCFAQYCHVIIVQGDSLSPCDQLNAGFQVTANGNTASFHSGNVPGAAYSWYFGDGTQGNGPDPSHTYAQPGQYHACLVTYAWDAVTQDTCMADHCEWVTIIGGGSPCDSLFQVSYTYSQQGGAVFLSAHSTLPTQQFMWDFGDGTTAYGPVQQHGFAPGQYNVCLYGWYSNSGVLDSCMAHTCQWIVIHDDSTGVPCDSLNAHFTVDVDGNAASFTNHVVNSGMSYEWHFGDGTTGSGPDPEHFYPGPGQYQACLMTYSWDGQAQDTCMVDFCQWVTVNGTNTPCDSLWMPSFDWSAGDAVINLWNTTNDLGWDNVVTWYSNGVAIGSGDQVSFHPGNTEAVDVCMVVNLYNSAQQLLCSGTVCDSVGLTLPTSITDLAGTDGISVYPQPFNEQLTVNAHGLNGAVRATLLDMSGRLVDDRQVTLNGPATFNYAGLPAGSYVLRLQGADGDRVVRVLKN